MITIRFLLPAGALAAFCVAANLSIPHDTVIKSPIIPDKLRADPDASYEKHRGRDNVRAVVGNGGEADRGASTFEEEKYLNRAFPAAEIPFSLTLNAQHAYSKVRGRGRGRKSGVWSLFGPSTATVPPILSVYGAVGEEYVTSGRITSVAISSRCRQSKCRVWIGAAGGGVWRTDRAISQRPFWDFVSGALPTNAIGSIEIDPNDPSGETIYVGTGEANASGDSAAGLGLFKSTDGGDHWTLVGNSHVVAFGRSIGSIAVHPTDPSILYMASARGVRGVSSVTGGATSNPLAGGLPALGLYKSIDGGATWTLAWNGNNSLRGVRRVKLDPLNPNVVYAASYQQGLWRSPDGGATWERIFFPTSFLLNTNRTEFDVTVKNGATRIYVADGAQGNQGVAGATYSQVFRADAVNTTPAAALVGADNNAGWTSLTSPDPTNLKYGSYDFCTGQCWYDSFIITPKGHPDIVYLGGSHQYGETYGRSNGRGLVLSTDSGETFTDMTVEGGRSTSINLHPDHHQLVVHPDNPFIFFSVTDGGIVRSTGRFTDMSADCATRELTPASLTACQRLLSRVPHRLESLNHGLSTLQFQSVLVDPDDRRNLIGGTQDNGTWKNDGARRRWDQTIYGDGGQAGFSSADSRLVFNTFTGQANDVNFRNGDPNAWVVATGPIVASPEGSAFYPPVTADPNPMRGLTIFQGSQSVWRTQNWGGDQAYLEANCPEFTTSAANPACGDFVRIGPAGATDLTAAALGTRAGSFVAAIERSAGDTGSLWVATGTGRVFISTNADAAAASVVFTRLDSLAVNSPARFVSSIHVDPKNGNRAWISYGGYNFNTPAQPGHVFEVTYNPGTGAATWLNLDAGLGPMGDLPVTDLVRDDESGDLYAATDFGVLILPSGASTWTDAGVGLPNVEVAGLTIVPSERLIYAATHGRSIWRMFLP